MRFEGARFELFGMPLATLPAFEIADPTVKRKTGFLIPGIEYKSELGVGLRVPFYLALAPNYDLLLSTTAYTKQGFLAEAEFRHRLENGIYSLKVAGIHQANSDQFSAGTVDSTHTNRGMVASTGRFTINPRWTFGWDVMAQSDKNFSNTYGIDGYSDYYRKNEVYLTGLSGRNYLDLHAYEFNVQEELNASVTDAQQPIAGVVDYSMSAPNPVAGGELNFDLNAQGISRDLLDRISDATAHNYLNTYGVGGATGRLSAEAEWKRTIIAPGGLALTPIFALRGDGNLLNTGDLVRSQAFRGMATAGLDARWPILFSTTSATHILEPVAQIFVRNNEQHAGVLPNEDAQSFVFDTTTLLARDKFSGWDRMEGGTRANLALRYSGTFANGWTSNAMVGQSYHLAGMNTFAQPDVVDAGMNSGLDTNVSDVVASIGVANSEGLMMALRGRFDEKTAEIRRSEAEIAYSGTPVSASLQYAFIQAQPGYGYDVDRQEVGASAGVEFGDNWRMFGSTTYNIENKYFSAKSLGLAYSDSCTSLTLTYAETRSLSSAGVASSPVRSIGFNLSFRTLGDIGTSY